MIFDETFNVNYDETDMIQVEEDTWISDVIGTEDEVINDLVYGK